LEEKFFNDLEENDPIKNLVMAIHSVDCYQLVGLQSEWIEKKSNSVQEYQTEILKMKHPSITNENIQNVLENATFYFLDDYNLQDNLVNIEN
ncbi:15001_t:CDS:2, partial [Racocetra persica]